MGVLAASLLTEAPTARANGAFPDAQSVLLPRDRPNEIILATTFGLVSSEDDGQSWSWACETAATSGGFRYVTGPPSSGGTSGDRLFAISNPPPGAPMSADDGCTWTLPGGAIASDPEAPLYATDVFPDPSDPARVFLLAGLQDAGAVYRSRDGGLTYGGPLFTPPSGGDPVLTGVEVATAAAGSLYVTWYERTGSHPHLARSLDGGDTWTDLALDGALGPLKPYLAAVDPVDPQVVFLRTISADGVADQRETLAVTRDGGATWSTPVTLAGGSFQGFVRRADGTVLALGRPASTDATVPSSTLYRSADGGRTFSSAPLGFHGKGMSERGGTLFLATDNVIDLVALASSTDGVSWRPRLRFEDISSIKGCVFASCRDACDLLLGTRIFSPDACSRSSDAASGGRGGAANGGAGGGRGGAGGGGGGCSCATSASPGPAGERGDRATLLASAALVVLLLARRATGRAGGRTSRQSRRLKPGRRPSMSL